MIIPILVMQIVAAALGLYADDGGNNYADENGDTYEG